MVTRSEILRLGVDARPAQAGLKKYDIAAKRAAVVTASLRIEVRRLEGELKRMSAAQTGVQTITRKTSNQITAMAKRIAIAAAAFAALRTAMSSLTIAADVGRQMSITGALTGQTSEDTKRLRLELSQLSLQTGESIQGLAEATVVLAQAGKSLGEIQLIMQRVADFARIGQIGIAAAADLTIRTMAQFDKQAAQSTKVMDILTRQAVTTRIGIARLGETMKFAGPVAHSLGISLEETAAAAGVLGQSGLDASLAGTGLRGIMLSLIKPTQEAKDLFHVVGLTADQVNPSLVGLAGAFEALNAAGVSNIQLSRIFTKRQIASALVVRKSTRAMRLWTKENENANGITEELSDTIRDDLRGSVDELIAAWEDLKITFGESAAFKVMIGTLKTLVSTISRAVKDIETLGKLFPEHRVAAPPVPALKPGQVPRAKDIHDLGPSAQAESLVGKDGARLISMEETRNRIKRENLLLDEKMRDKLESRISGEANLNKLVEDRFKKISKVNSTFADSKELQNEMRELITMSVKETLKWASAMEKAKEDAETLKQTYVEIGEAIGNSIGSALEDLIFEGKKFRDVMKALVGDILRELFRVTVVKQIVSGLGSLAGGLSPGTGNLASSPPGGVGPIQQPGSFSANGNAFSGGRVIPFASGGALVDRPTTFPMAGGNTGLMGEAGPEAIFPLKRQGGKLGLDASGSQGNTYNTNIVVHAKDADSFKRSERQIADRMRNAMSRRTA